ncbi:DUF3307 domain-containing protein [Martelella mediterranea]|uniref:Uncharacterized protein DUF3307 n=1 Tax=Martelella mediterranea TaxID=293089 RepID=A0A4R3NIV7_9HYPH|nr:DUF3307 domain-containing protein [Martelella mediterranea]TCT34618.1 uncharacterized protein DUF3307 [Martelella mediterranea]
MIEVLALLIAAHALADYPLQGDFLARAKNQSAPLPGVPWYQALGAHSAIHAGFVGVITNSVWLGLAEFAAHWVIDYEKSAGRLSFNQDQFLHLFCKLAWTVLFVLLVAEDL